MASICALHRCMSAKKCWPRWFPIWMAYASPIMWKAVAGSSMPRHAHKLEGVVSKRADAPYLSGRSRLWLKLRCGKGQEVVIGGYTESGAGRHFGSLLAGYFSGEDLVFCGKIKTGYSQKTLEDTHRYPAPL